MKEYDALFDVYEHLKELPREAEALFLLRRAASLVKPIMRKRGWTVRTLAEFLPPDPRLQGMYHISSCSGSGSSHETVYLVKVGI